MNQNESSGMNRNFVSKFCVINEISVRVKRNFVVEKFLTEQGAVV